MAFLNSCATVCSVIIFRTHRPQIAAFGTLTGLFGIRGFLQAVKDPSRLRQISGALGGSYFFAQTLYFAKRVFKKEAICLGKEGLMDQVGSPPAGFIPWEKIAKAEVVAVPLGFLVRKFVGIRLQSVDDRTVGRARPTLEPPMLEEFAMLVPEFTLEERVEDVVETINFYLEDQDERDELSSLLLATGSANW